MSLANTVLIKSILSLLLIHITLMCKYRTPKLFRLCGIKKEITI
jgi:hypothetical protein